MTDMISKEIREAIEEAYYWSCLPDGNYILYISDDQFFPLSKEAASAVDWRLPDYLQSQKTEFKPFKNWGVTATDVDKALSYWSNPYRITFSTPDETTVDIDAIVEIRTSIADVLELEIVENVLESFTAEKDGLTQKAYWKTSSRNLTVLVERSWFEENHPEWEKRWLSLESLAVPYEERPRFLLGENISPNEPIINVPDDFDTKL